MIYRLEVGLGLLDHPVPASLLEAVGFRVQAQSHGLWRWQVITDIEAESADSALVILIGLLSKHLDQPVRIEMAVVLPH